MSQSYNILYLFLSLYFMVFYQECNQTISILPSFITVILLWMYPNLIDWIPSILNIILNIIQNALFIIISKYPFIITSILFLLLSLFIQPLTLWILQKNDHNKYIPIILYTFIFLMDLNYILLHRQSITLIISTFCFSFYSINIPINPYCMLLCCLSHFNIPL